MPVGPDFVAYFKRTTQAVQRCKNEQQRCSYSRARVGRRSRSSRSSPRSSARSPWSRRRSSPCTGISYGASRPSWSRAGVVLRSISRRAKAVSADFGGNRMMPVHRPTLAASDGGAMPVYRLWRRRTAGRRPRSNVGVPQVLFAALLAQWAWQDQNTGFLHTKIGPLNGLLYAVFLPLFAVYAMAWWFYRMLPYGARRLFFRPRRGVSSRRTRREDLPRPPRRLRVGGRGGAAIHHNTVDVAGICGTPSSRRPRATAKTVRGRRSGAGARPRASRGSSSRLPKRRTWPRRPRRSAAPCPRAARSTSRRASPGRKNALSCEFPRSGDTHACRPGAGWRRGTFRGAPAPGAVSPEGGGQ